MKRSFLFFVWLLCTGYLSAQQSLGIASFTVPAGWSMTEQSNGVLLESKSAKGQMCQIIITSTEPVAVNSAETYVDYRSKRSTAVIRYKHEAKSVKRNEANGLISYASGGTGKYKDMEVQSYFYSISNNQASFFVQLLTSTDACIQEFNRFLSTLKTELADEDNNQGGKTVNARKANDDNKTKRKKKAVAAAPAAPAPIM